LTGGQAFDSADTYPHPLFGHRAGPGKSGPETQQMTHHTIPTIRWQDVIHSWSVPSLGIKTDATPGRINRAQGGVFLGVEVFLAGL